MYSIVLDEVCFDVEYSDDVDHVLDDVAYDREDSARRLDSRRHEFGGRKRN